MAAPARAERDARGSGRHAPGSRLERRPRARAARRRDPRRLRAGAARAATRADRGRSPACAPRARPVAGAERAALLEAARASAARSRACCARARRHALPGALARAHQAARRARHPGHARDRRAHGAGLPRARLGRVRAASPCSPPATDRSGGSSSCEMAVTARDRLRAGRRVRDAARAACWSERASTGRALGISVTARERSGYGRVLAAPVRRFLSPTAASSTRSRLIRRRGYLISGPSTARTCSHATVGCCTAIPKAP